MHTSWLLPTALLFASAHAFYPIHSRKPSQDSTQAKRFFPVPSENAESQGSRSVTLNIVKIPTPSKRDNTFPVVIANKADLPNAMAINEGGQDYSYFSTMKFGSKETPMYMLIDSGSANTWVMGTECTSTSCQDHNQFGPPDSTTLNVTKNPWTLTYGTGTVQGVVVSDTVAFANYSIDLGFGLAMTASDDFSSYPMDGILGLGRPSSNILGTPTIMQVLDTKNELTSNIIGVHLQRDSDGAKDGQITFGGVDKTKFTGSISYTNALASDGNWEIAVGGCGVNGVSANLTSKTATIDTGTSYILMPPTDAQALHSLIPGAVANGEYYSMPCSTTVDVQFTFSGATYSISSKDYLGKASGTMCASNIIGHQAFGPNQWILGDVFLKNVYTVFDYDKSRIGFGTKTGVVASSSSAVPASSSVRVASSSNRAASTSVMSTLASSIAASSSSSTVTTSASSRTSSSSSSTVAPTTTADAAPLGGTSSGAVFRPALAMSMVAGMAFAVGLLI